MTVAVFILAIIGGAALLLFGYVFVVLRSIIAEVRLRARLQDLIGEVETWRRFGGDSEGGARHDL